MELVERFDIQHEDFLAFIDVEGSVIVEKLGDADLTKHTNVIDPPTQSLHFEEAREKDQPPIPAKLISVENLKEIFVLPHTAEEVTRILHRSIYDCFVGLEGFVKNGNLKKESEKYAVG